ncbi:hypothetical protein JCM21900_005177 [Sporobolomyces salmonicolor]
MPARLSLRSLRSPSAQTLAATRRAFWSSASSRLAGAKQEGSIASVFSSLGGDPFVPLEGRFGDLKRNLWNDGLIESWRSVLAALRDRTEEIKTLGSAAIPQVGYAELAAGKLSQASTDEIKRVGTVVVHGGVTEEEALGWKEQIKEYIAKNRSLAKGFPADDPQVWELYNTVAQTKARSHPALLSTQTFLLSLFHTSDPNSLVSLNSPISYFDRLRIRSPGDSLFALGPHIDGGSLERWEDSGFRSCWSEILRGGPDPHTRHDSYNLTPRLNAVTDLYNGAGQCSAFRMYQGWTALSRTSLGEGTLQVFPDVNLATAYLILRPFFRERRGREGRLPFDDWEPDLDSTVFPGAVKGKAQELSPRTHPHLRLSETMTSIPRVVPGSQVYWHTDVVHAVEPKHAGATDSSVLYIPACPLTPSNAKYLAEQRATFEAGRPPVDFPGGEGESRFEGRATEKDIEGEAARRAMGYAPFVAREGETAGGKKVTEEANRILFGGRS